MKIQLEEEGEKLSMMREKNKKILKIIDVFSTYCVFVGGKHIKMETKIDDQSHFELHIQSDYHPMKKKHIVKLQATLDMPKDPSVETMYWNVIGNEEFQDDNDMYIVASMLDEAKVTYDDHCFEVRVRRTIIEE